ncbi:MAG: tol-pal system protein YbgF [Rhodocyclaceae bacterium]
MIRSKISAAALGLLLAHSAHAALFDDDEARRRIDQLRNDTDARLKSLEDSQRAQLQLNNQLDQLRNEVNRLRGQIEQMTNDLDQAQKRQKDFYVDLDGRLRKLEGAVTNLNQASAPVAPSGDPASESRDYGAALDSLRAGKYVDAANAFKNFIKTYPKSAFQPSANFWAGSAYFQARDIDSAREYYNRVVTGWPDDAMAPDAMLGLSNTQNEKGDKKAARATLEQIVARYPTSDAAKTAKQRLGKK